MESLKVQLGKLNQTSIAECLSINKLRLDFEYPVERLEIVSSKYGECVIAYLMDVEKGNNKLIKVFLPKRYRQSFEPEFIHKFNEGEFAGVGSMTLIYKGMIGKTYNLEFK